MALVQKLITYCYLLTHLNSSPVGDGGVDKGKSLRLVGSVFSLLFLLLQRFLEFLASYAVRVSEERCRGRRIPIIKSSLGLRELVEKVQQE